VLRISDIGEPAPGNPDPSSPIYTRGHNDVAGLCSASGSNQVFEIEARASGPGEVNVLAAGADYGWPDAGPSTKAAAGELPPGTTRPGGCAAFSSTLYVASLDGARVLSAPLSGRGAAIKPGKYSTLTKKYGRIRTAVGDPAGAIWLTTSNKDGHGKPIASDERVIRIPLGGGSGGDNPR
jgi:glucose/arabinose dehydrogenase